MHLERKQLSCKDRATRSTGEALWKKNTRGGPGRKNQSAFTLLEVVLAVTIAGAILAAAATLMVSISSVWIERNDRNFFEDHVDGVVEFLHASFSSAGSEISAGEASPSGDPSEAEPPEADEPTLTTGDRQRGSSGQSDGQTASLIQTSEEPVAWLKPPGYAEYQDPLLHFALSNTPPVMIQTENAPVAGIHAFLYFEPEEGLSLLWYSPLQEESTDIQDLRRTPVSDLITLVEYIYWDERFENWETETEPKEGETQDTFLLPRFLKLTFEYQGETKERTLTIPVPSRSVVLF